MQATALRGWPRAGVMLIVALMLGALLAVGLFMRRASLEAPSASRVAVQASSAGDSVAQRVAASVAGPAGRVNPVPELEEAVHRLIGRTSGSFGVAIKDIDSGAGILLGADTQFETASLYKLAVMYEAFKARELGALSFDESLQFSAEEAAADPGAVVRTTGSFITVSDALERMITLSDNGAALVLRDRLGDEAINRDLRELGLERTRLEPIDSYTTARDMLTFLEALAKGSAVSPTASQEMMQLMERQQIRDRIPLLLPPEASAANKTGNLPGIVNDVGIVSHPKGRFAIAVLVADTEAEDSAAFTISEISRTALDYFRR
jgi:beta-lactamase class A